MSIYEEIMEMARVKQNTAKKFFVMFKTQFSAVTGSPRFVFEESADVVNGIGNSLLIFNFSEENAGESKIIYKFTMNFEAIEKDKVLVEIRCDDGKSIHKALIPLNNKMDQYINAISDAIKAQICCKI